jgi:hypothetical protein
MYNTTFRPLQTDERSSEAIITPWHVVVVVSEDASDFE